MDLRRLINLIRNAEEHGVEQGEILQTLIPPETGTEPMVPTIGNDGAQIYRSSLFPERYVTVRDRNLNVQPPETSGIDAGVE